MRRTHLSFFRFLPRVLLGAVCLCAGLLGATAGAHEPMLDNSGRYPEELRACREGRTAEDRPTCEREARNAEADRKRGRLTNAGDFQQNALARCQAFDQADDKEACRARVVGHVEITGSVAGGGILRQVAITTRAPQEPALPGSAMGAGMPPSTTPPSNDIGTDEALPEEQDLDAAPDEGETLEQQPPAPEPAR